MYKRLTPEQRHQLEMQGACSPIKFLKTEEVNYYRQAFEAMEKRVGKQLEYVGRTHLYLRWSYELATHPVLLDIVEDVLGPDILIWASLILVKQPRTKSFVNWHQDRYHNERSSQSKILSAWIALSDSTPENGCMRIIPNSHKYQKLTTDPDLSEHNMLLNASKISEKVDESQAQNLCLQSGELSLHHDCVIHGSHPNCSDTRRIGFIVRFTIPEASNPRTAVVYGRGRQNYHHLPMLEQAPSQDESLNLVNYINQEGPLYR